jgi:hypothetical protein
MMHRLLDIGDFNRYHEVGLGLVEKVVDVMGRRSSTRCRSDGSCARR